MAVSKHTLRPLPELEASPWSLRGLRKAPVALKLILVIGSVGLYLLMFWIFASLGRRGGVVFGAIPVIAASWLWGRQVGIGLILGASIGGLGMAQLLAGPEASLLQHIGESLILVLVGAVAIWVRQLDEANEALLYERARLEAAMSFIGEGVQIATPDFRVEYVNPAWERNTGYQAAETLGRSAFDLLRTRANDEAIFERIRKAIQRGKSWRGEIALRRKDGQLTQHQTTISALRDAAGQPSNIVIVKRDITEQNELAQEIRAFSAMPDIVFRVDSQGNLLSFKAPVDPERERTLSVMLGVSVLVSLPPELMPEDIVHRVFQMATLALQSKEAHSLEYSMSKGGKRKHYEARLLPNEMEAEVLIVVRDISERKRLERALELTQLSFRNVIERNKDGIIIVDENNVVRFLNRAAKQYFRQSVRLGELFDYPIVSGTSTEVDIVLEVRQGGEEVMGVGEMRVMQTRWVGESAYLASIRDITERKEAERKLEHQAYHDMLTGLPNRAMLLERLELSLARASEPEGQHFALLFMDLDRFKNVNDSLGHDAGDQLLVELATRLQGCMRQGDTVARMGGDEFVILLEDIHEPAVAQQMAQRILDALNGSFRVKGHALYTSGSIGIALSETGYEAPQDMLRDADTAMYRAKELGKSRYIVFDQQMHQRALRLLQIESDLQRAIEQGEFFLHFQPIISLQTQMLVGFEVLVRWMHPRDGLISPGEFIEVAEETGMIVPIGWWVMREACRQTRAWQQQFPQVPPVPVSVNLSARQFAQADLVHRVLQILVETGLSPQLLKLEITESALIEQVDVATRMLEQLQGHGIQVHMDDFGTGYSSLSYLARFPIDALKIDQSFVRDMEIEPDNAEIVRAIISMAHSLHLSITAEGAENFQQIGMLRAFGCERVQGYGVSRPVDVHSATQMVQQPDWFAHTLSKVLPLQRYPGTPHRRQ